MEAEVFRDSLLHLSGRLRWALDGGPMGVKSQDPSPKDLANNQSIYEKSDRRSVYLPVVRSNVYDLLTLLDFPNAATPVGSRVTTTVPTQALLMMNGDYLMNESRNIAKKWLNTVDTDPTATFWAGAATLTQRKSRPYGVNRFIPGCCPYALILII